VSPSTFRVLDAIADSFNPLLAIAALAAPFLRRPRSWHDTAAYYLAGGAAIALVYLVMAIDARHRIWASAGLDYSTHSAFAASLVAPMSAFYRRWLVPLAALVAAYFSFQLLLGYHGLLDILSSAVLAAAASLLFHFAATRVSG
jgi:hypothetical protein